MSGRPMEHARIFHKLLGIPSRNAAPTPCDLLGLTPQSATSDRVAACLAERKKRLRQNIPGPQFIPLVSLWERELEKAAAILTDPAEWKAYQRRRAAGGDATTPEPPPQRGTDSAVETTPWPEGRTSADVAPSPGPSRAPRERGGRRYRSGGPAQESIEYFRGTVQQALAGGWLARSDEIALVALAGNLAIPARVAQHMIERELAARGAHRGEPVVAEPASPSTPTGGRGPGTPPPLPSPVLALPSGSGMGLVQIIGIPLSIIALFVVLAVVLGTDFRKGSGDYPVESPPPPSYDLPRNNPPTRLQPSSLTPVNTVTPSRPEGASGPQWVG